MYLKDIVYQQALQEGGTDSGAKGARRAGGAQQSAGGVQQAAGLQGCVCAGNSEGGRCRLWDMAWTLVDQVCRLGPGCGQAPFRLQQIRPVAPLPDCMRLPACLTIPLLSPTNPADEEELAGRAPPRTYAQEQDELKRAFLSAFEETEAGEAADGEGGFGAGVLKQRADKARKAAERAAGQDGGGQEPGGGGGGGTADAEARVQQLLDGYFGRDEELSKEDRFLKRYILNKVGRGAMLRRAVNWARGERSSSAALPRHWCPPGCWCGVDIHGPPGQQYVADP